MTSRFIRAFALAVTIVSCLPAAGVVAAGWAPLGPLAGPTNDAVQSGVTRDASGVLHVLWQRGGDLLHAAVAPDGAIGAPNALVTGWSTMSTPDVVAVPGGLLAVFSGFQGGGIETDLSTAASTDGGATWAIDTSKFKMLSDAPSLAVGPDLTPFIAAGALQVIRGFARPGQAGADSQFFNFQTALTGECCGYSPNIERSGSGLMWLSWYSSASADKRGVFVQQVDPATGDPAGPAALMPGSTTEFEGSLESVAPYGRVGLAPRAGSADMFAVAGGGYPTPTRPLVWRVGSDRAVNLSPRFGKKDPITAITVAPGAGGRMWVVWSTGEFDDVRIHARRSNAAATRWSAETVIKPPKYTVKVLYLDGNEAPDGGLDVVTHGVPLNGPPNSAPYLTRMLPSLTVTGSPLRIDRKDTTAVTFRVTEAFAAVKGATVTIGGRHGRTDSKGRVTIKVDAPAKKGKLRAKATAPGFAPGRFLLSVG